MNYFRQLLSAAAGAGLLTYCFVAQALQFDLNPAWPLCGRITEAPPANWSETDGCPSSRWGNADFSDFPLSSTFGPRQLVSENYRYDFHRGIDIATPIGTPVFAIADGVVKKIGNESGYSDPVVVLRHYRPGSGNSCTAGGGCYHSAYLHLFAWDSNLQHNDSVSKGQLLGWTGVSASGFEHLHFEIRNAVAEDPFSYWQQDAVHPLHVLPYADNNQSSIEVSIGQVSQIRTALTVSANIVVPPSELDFMRIEALVYQRKGKSLIPVDQPGNMTDSFSYNVLPPWFDVDIWNRQYTHKDSTAVPWELFDIGGEHECPYYEDHPLDYDAYVHLDQADPENFQVGLFNGLSVAPQHYNAESDAYRASFTFHSLVGAANPVKTCVIIEVTDVRGKINQVSENCN